MSAKIITTIHVEKLFGLYTYSLPQDSELANAAILYGDNGVGKSTVLRLVYHLLSSGRANGHRTALYETDFSHMEVRLTSGIRLTATSQITDGEKVLILCIYNNKRKLSTWNFIPGKRSDQGEYGNFLIGKDGRMLIRRKNEFSAANRSTKDGEKIGEESYCAILKKVSPTVFILNAERRLDSDSVADPGDEMELRNLLRFDTPKSLSHLVVRTRQIGLTQALTSASKWISQKAIIGTNQGSTNVNTVYEDVIRHLLSNSSELVDEFESSSLMELVERIVMIEERMAAIAKYELGTLISVKEFKKLLRLQDLEKTKLAVGLLQPYVRSLERRLEAVDNIYQTVDKFITTINGFLNDKQLTYQLSNGFTIKNKFEQNLDATQLSSGEQQLLLLFCYALTARDTPSVFMIDEPEISLNVKWQRQLIQSLLDVTEGSKIQFLFASHSMELLSQHMNRVVKLVNLEK